MNVAWHEVALDHLADIYAAAPAADRDALARCVGQTNQRLATDSGSVGESHGRTRRVWFNRPLMVVFDVRGDGVLVVHVSHVRPDPGDRTRTGPAAPRMGFRFSGRYNTNSRRSLFRVRAVRHVRD